MSMQATRVAAARPDLSRAALKLTNSRLARKLRDRALRPFEHLGNGFVGLAGAREFLE